MPATVAIVPPALTRRMRSLPVSAIRKLPSGSAATPSGWFSWAEVAGPPSPAKPAPLVPATVVMTPFSTLRMRLSPVSAIRKPLPFASGETPRGWLSRTSALTASTPSPAKLPPAPQHGPAPATVAIVPPASTRRMRPFDVSAIR